MTTERGYEPLTVNARIKLSAAWTAMLFVFAYVDLFSLYRSDVRAELDAGVISGFAIDQIFLLATTIYVAIPSLMVVAALVLAPRVSRITNMAVAGVYALTIVVAAIGEWGYYLLGSAVELVLLAAIVRVAWTWPRVAPAPGRVGAGAGGEVSPAPAV